MKKTLLMLMVVLLIVTIFPISPVNANAQLSDVGGHWAKNAINDLVTKDIIDGYGDGSFRPENVIQVDEFIKLTVTALKHFPSASRTGYWADPYIAKAKELRLIGGAEFKNYRRAIRREEMSAIIVNAYGLENSIILDNMKTLVRDQINDYSLIDDFYKDEVLTAYTEGLINGKGNGKFDPRGLTKRAEAATVIIRLLNDDARQPISFGDHPYTTARVHGWDDELGWSDKFYDIFAPVNDRKEVVEEVLTLHDRIKETEKQEYGYYEIKYNPRENSFYSHLYPDIETLDLSANEQAENMDMSFSVDFLRFREEFYPYDLIIYRKASHYEDMSTYYNYIDDRYGDFMNVYADVLFEGEAQRALSLIETMLNNTKWGVLQTEEIVINNRNVYIVSNNGLTVWVGDKLD